MKKLLIGLFILTIILFVALENINYIKEGNINPQELYDKLMSDIFVKLSLIGKGIVDEIDEFIHPHLKNIYGELLKTCRKNPKLNLKVNNLFLIYINY